MATWQHSYILIPQSKLLERYGVIPSEIDDDFNEVKWWEGESIPSNEELGAILPRTTCSWSEEIEYWGTDKTNLISRIYEDKELVEMGVRIDLRTKYEEIRELVQKIIDLAQTHGLCFVSLNGLILPADYEVIANDLKRSDAQVYVNDPMSEIIDHALETGQFRVVEMKLDKLKHFEASELRDPEDEEDRENEDEEFV